MSPLLAIEDYHLAIPTFDGPARVLDGIDLALDEGETLGIVGESGCGKTVLARSILGIGPGRARRTGGRILFEGRDVGALSERDWRGVRGVKISMIFQDPMTYLNPLFTIGRQLGDAIAAHARAQGATKPGRAERRARAAELLAQVALREPERVLDSYPHQLSGGMRQRVLIALALSGKPRLLIADEPTTALDVTVQAQVLRLLRDLVETLRLTVVMISHDVGAIAALTERVAVMYAGNVVEEGATARVLARPLHPYTRGLLAALPEIDGEIRRLTGVPGTIPSLIDPPSGCRFHPRCPRATAICTTERPAMRRADPVHTVACHHADLA
ncbi:oligopeptide/dipeptide ABC transporter, ATP-binding protein, C-terminal domain-containing protein [Methylobacterium sp. 174MFSha1.1]|uniref:ABC transporter ATP-binding protein n=1 Tax=Methylobacterium sp. 174MFSha1.1 TaxID=1502749 RepID=UPI0008E61CEC|nr:ABC transporter ATP-binding protein [Methylobacterium sp. 174MFSha1.1]SFU74786.1 oligopeptide/dipeptide ABC transporter, ATP-binding protein, C-terminal domain-containing protein [Methylobacterium sp. 174MFSha1.1]